MLVYVNIWILIYVFLINVSHFIIKEVVEQAKRIAKNDETKDCQVCIHNNNY